MENERVVVIGGGVIGVTTACMLKLRSPHTNVLLLERNSGAAQECSFQNGAVLNYSSCDVWPGPGFPYAFLRGIWNRDNKFQHNWRNLANPQFWLWAGRMLWNCSKASFEEHSASLWKLGQRSYNLHLSLREQLKAQFAKELSEYNFTYPGTLNLYDNNLAFEHAKERGKVLNKTLAQKIVFFATRKNCAQVEPAVAKIASELVGCAKNYSEDIGSHDSYKFTQAFLSIGQTLGVNVLFDSRVTSFTVANNRVTSLTLENGQVVEAERFVICAGIHSRALGQMLGWTPPLWAVKGYSMNVTSQEFQLGYLVAPHGEFGTYLVPHPGGFRYSYFAEFTDPEDSGIDPARAEQVENLLRAYTGVRDLEFTNRWACLRPVSCDDLPIIGQFPKLENVYLNVGQGSRGSLLALGSAELCVDVMLGQQSPVINPKDFSPDRFSI